MDSVKRRLVYVADENESMLRELTGTPPVRPSRLSKLHITPSSGSSVGLAQSVEVAPNDGEDRAVARTNPLLLVSFEGFLLADGTGRLFPPRSAETAAQLHAALKDCRDFLRQYRAQTGSQLSSSFSSTSDVSSSTYQEEEEESSEDDTLSDIPSRQRRPQKPATSLGGPNRLHRVGVTVAELREELRHRGLPVSGTKSALQQRLRLFDSQCGALQDEAEHPVASSRPSTPPLPERSAISAAATFSSISPISSTPQSSLSPRSSEGSLRASGSVPRRLSTKGIWEVLCDAGSRFFRRTTDPTEAKRGPAVSLDHSDEPPFKRRRSV